MRRTRRPTKVSEGRAVTIRPDAGYGKASTTANSKLILIGQRRKEDAGEEAESRKAVLA